MSSLSHDSETGRKHRHQCLHSVIMSTSKSAHTLIEEHSAFSGLNGLFFPLNHQLSVWESISATN